MSCTDYRYVCLACGKKFPGSGRKNSFRLNCDDCGDSSLLEAEYNSIKGQTAGVVKPAAWQALNFDCKDTSFFRYRDWLPVYRSFAQASLPAVLRSKAIARNLGLKDLDILFSGYHPSTGSDIRSATFKEFEAYSVFAYLHGSCAGERILVVASAGNTARAFAEMALRENLPVILVVPDVALKEMKLSLPIMPDSRVVFVASTHKYDDQPSEYAEAIELAKVLCQSPHFLPEGGIKNIARRDGLGVGYLHAQFSRFQERPDAKPYRYYFQAIGSGAGAIGSYGMYKRLKRAGCIPQEHQLSLMLAQNAPFIPVVEHWRDGKQKFQPYEATDSLERNKNILAHVLANRNPPYTVVGGLSDVLQESGGACFAVENHEVIEMREYFAIHEGLDIMPAAAVAAAALRQAVRSKQIDREQPVLLHLTGGGQAQLERDFPQRHEVQAACTVDWQDLQDSPAEQQKLVRQVEQLLGF